MAHHMPVPCSLCEPSPTLKRPVHPPADDQADAASLLPALAAQLPSAAALAAVFASVEDAPQAPATPDQAQAAASLATATAAHLRLLEDLAAQLDASQLGLSALALSGSGGDGGAAEDVGPPGSVRIEELDAAEPSPDLAVTLVLAATLYGGAASLGRPWAEGEVAAAAARLLAAAARCTRSASGCE